MHDYNISLQLMHSHMLLGWHWMKTHYVISLTTEEQNLPSLLLIPRLTSDSDKPLMAQVKSASMTGTLWTRWILELWYILGCNAVLHGRTASKFIPVWAAVVGFVVLWRWFNPPILVFCSRSLPTRQGSTTQTAKVQGIIDCFVGQ